MAQIDGIKLLDCVHPHFFERENIKNLPEEWICEELVIPLNEFVGDVYNKSFEKNITFGYYEGDMQILKEAVGKVLEGWIEFYTGEYRTYCGYIDGKIASFCMVEDMGVHTIDGKELKLGGPGCVGTLPEYRNLGIGLTMVSKVTQILKEEGYDYSYIHFTRVPQWYKKLGYKTSLRWNRNGALENFNILK